MRVMPVSFRENKLVSSEGQRFATFGRTCKLAATPDLGPENPRDGAAVGARHNATGRTVYPHGLLDGCYKML